MKIVETRVNIPSSKYILNLSEKDIAMIEAVISPPFGDFAKLKITEWLTGEDVKKIKEFIKVHKNEKETLVEPGFLSKLRLGFKESCEILDPGEIETITGYSWNEAMDLYGRMFKAEHYNFGLL